MIKRTWILHLAAVCSLAQSTEPIVFDYETVRSQQNGNRHHITTRQECRSVVLGSDETPFTVGVESNGSNLYNATRQFIALNAWKGDHWTALGKVSERDGYVYTPAMAADTQGGVWIAWSQFNEIEQDWDVYARHFDGSRFGKVTRVSSNRGPDTRPAVLVHPDGAPMVAWEAGTRGSIQIMTAVFRGGAWHEEAATGSAGFNFRPALAADRDGAIWLAWDRWVNGDYDVYLRTQQNGNWSDETAVLASDADEQRPAIRVAPDNTVWIQAGKRVVGVKDGKRHELPGAAESFVAGLGTLEEFQIDGQGRMWFFSETRPDRTTGNVAPPLGETAAAWFDGRSLRPFTYGSGMGYRAPVFDSEGAFWHATQWTVLRAWHDAMATNRAAAIVGREVSGPLAETKAAKPAPAHVPHFQLELDGETYTLYWGEQHTHLRERPTDRILEFWIDRYYLNAWHRGVLDFAAASDHDWQSMTTSKYRFEQAYANTIGKRGEFEGFSGYEWSGDRFAHRRYGDRTIVYTRDYSPVFRITDPASDTPAELHGKLAAIDALDWVHHVGAPWAVMDWSLHDPVAEPVMEITSNHGIYETCDRDRAVPDWLRREPVGDSSIQAGLGQGKKFGFVGSSDRHGGISGYATGMLGVYTKDLTRASILEALRARRTLAVRGGEPTLVDFRLNGAFQGGEAEARRGGQELSVRVQAQSPIDYIEVIRDGQYIYTHRPQGDVKQTDFSYRDTAPVKPGTYYYVRAWMKGQVSLLDGRKSGKYAWSSPAWLK